MRSNLGLLVRPLSLAMVLSSHMALSQENPSPEDVAPLSPVEDTTLDGSNADAAAAVNAVPAASEENSQVISTEPAASSSSPTELNENSSSANADGRLNQENSVTQQQRAESPKKDEAVAQPAKDEASKPTDVRSKEESSKTDSGAKGTYGGRVFGRHRIQLAGNRPTFNEKQKCYEKFYGKPETYFSITGDWFPLDWWINPGITTRIGSYSVRGKAAAGSLDGSQVTSCDQLTIDPSSKTSLLFVPLQLGAKIQITPFSRKWLVVDVWGAGEYGWWQETRDNSSASGQTYTSTGRKPAISTGASVHILLNYLDEQTVRSMLDSMDIGYVYLTGFAERVKSQNLTGLTFGRQVVGVGFTFETYK
jgi:hypothetical protein